MYFSKRFLDSVETISAVSTRVVERGTYFRAPIIEYVYDIIYRIENNLDRLEASFEKEDEAIKSHKYLIGELRRIELKQINK